MNSDYMCVMQGKSSSGDLFDVKLHVAKSRQLSRGLGIRLLRWWSWGWLHNPHPPVQGPTPSAARPRTREGRELRRAADRRQGWLEVSSFCFGFYSDIGIEGVGRSVARGKPLPGNGRSYESVAANCATKAAGLAST